MGKSLYKTQPAFKAALDACDAVLSDYLEQPLLSVMFPEDGNEDLINQTAYTQPALFAIEYALAELWISWGIKPDYVIGHSVGEYVAACIAGVFSLEDGLKLIATRGRLMQSLPQDGDMAAIFAEPDEVAAAILNMENEISIAGVNGPGNTVISGKKEAVKKIVDQFSAKEIKTRILTVSHAFHSPLMEPILDEFEKVAEEVTYKPSKIAIVSNLTGDLLEVGHSPDAKYWRNHIREGVQFNDGMQTLAKEGVNVFIETGPHPTLTGMGKFAISEHKATWAPSLKRDNDDWEMMLQSIALLFVNGLEINWTSFDRYYIRQLEQIPNYAFQRNRFWKYSEGNEQQSEATGIKMVNKSRQVHPLLGERLHSPLIKDIIFEARYNTKSLDILDDHRIYGVSLIPATGYMEMALAAAKKAFGAGNHTVENLGILEAIPVAEEGYTTVQVTIAKDDNKKHFFQIYSHQQEEDEENDPENWTLNAAGNLQIESENTNAGSNDRDDLKEIQLRCKKEINVSLFYGKMQEHGFEHGHSLQVINKIWHERNEALGRFKLKEDSIQGAAHFLLHPGLTDGGAQLIAATFASESEKGAKTDIFLPVGVEAYRILKEGQTDLWCHVVRRDGKSDDNIMLNDLLWYNDDGNLVAEMIGLRHMRTTMNSLPKAIREKMDSWLYETEWRKDDLESDGKLSGKWLIFADNAGLSEKIGQKIDANGGQSLFVLKGASYEKKEENCWEINPAETGDYQKVLNEVFDLGTKGIAGIIHAWSANYNSSNELSLEKIKQAQFDINGSILALVQNIATTGWVDYPRLVMLTQNGQTVEGDEKTNPAHGSVWGLGRVLSMEHPELSSMCIDIDGSDNSIDLFLKELSAVSEEDQIVFRDTNRFVQRLIKSDISNDGSTKNQGPKRLESSKRGLLDNLQLVPMERQVPPKGVVEIKVHATGLNFRDVLNALDLYPGDPGPLGGECSGTVVAVGPEVENVKVGDEVMGIAGGSFSSYVLTWADLIIKKPANISHEEAATIPITFLTAHYALNHLAKIKKGDKVLIHAASGGVGQAAIQLAKLEGAVIFGTAGNDTKRNVVKELGADYVMNSRSLDYADEVMKITEDAGVDVVLNSLNGDYIPKNLSILSNKGSFLEIGKVDIWNAEQIKAERTDLDYHIIALDHLSETRPAFIRELFSELVGKFESGDLKPLQLKTYSSNEAESAFRFMMAAKHIGKVVIRQELADEIEENENETKELSFIDGTYLITGGLGALGLIVANWLVGKGAKNLMLMSRRAPSVEVKSVLEGFAAKDVTVKVVNADVADFSALSSEIEKAQQSLPEIKGIFHAAGILDDGVLMQQNWERFEKVMAPKITGSWNLHNLSKEMNLDFMVYFSSAASMLGSPGQSNYAAANAFMDSLTYYRRGLGLPATSINWGPWSSSGMAAVTDMSRRNSGGMGMISPEQGLQMMERILESGKAQVGVLPIQWKAFLKQFPGDTLPRFYDDFAGTGSSASKGPVEKPEFLKNLEDAEAENRFDMIIEFLKQQTVRVLGMESSTSVDIAQPLQSLGLDSLMAIELKNSIDSGVGKNLPATMVFNYPTIEALAGHLLEDVLKLGAAKADEESMDNDVFEKEETLSEIEELSDEEAEALLLKSLEEDDSEEEDL